MPAAAESSSPRVAVVGAGITGLSAALQLIRQHDTVHVDVYEACERAGGAIRTESRDGFLIEHGPDAFITNKPGGMQLCRDLGIEDELVGTNDEHRRSLVVHAGQPQPIPDGFMLMAPAKPLAILTTPILSPLGKLRLLSEAVRPRKRSNEDESLSSFVRRRFGDETFERLVQPLVGGIYTSDPEKLSLQATLPRFPAMEQQHGSVIRATLKNAAVENSSAGESGARYGLFATHRDGLSAIVDRLVQTLKSSGRVNLHLEQPITAVQFKNGWQVSLASKPDQSFDGVLVTAPSWIAAGLLSSVDSTLTDELQDIEYASTAIVVSAHRLSDFEHSLDAFGMVVPAIEEHNVLAVSFSSRKFRGRAPDGHVLVRTFVGGATQPELLAGSDEDVVAMAMADVTSLLGMKSDPLFTSIWRHERAMPQYHVGHVDRVERITNCVTPHAGLELAGNAYSGVGLPDCISSGYAAADRLLEHL